MRIKGLESGRGLAALIVLLYHIPMVFDFEFPQNELVQILIFPTKFGEQAVYFFMLLSGFVLSFAFLNTSSIQKFSTWATWRILRLFPVYLSSLFIAGFLLEPNVRISDLTNAYLFSNLTVYTGVNPPLWSLSVEIIISILLFPLVKSSNKSNTKLIIIVVLLYLLSYFADAWGIKGLLRSASFFVLGILIFNKRQKFPDIKNWKKLSLILLSFLLYFINIKYLNLILLLPLSVALIYFLENPSRLLVNRFSLFLGKYSFSLYATHWIALNLINNFKLHSILEIYLFSVSFSILLAIVFAYLVEFPCRSFARKFLFLK